MRAQEKVQKFAEVVCRDRPRLLRDAWAHDAKTTAQGWHREKTNAAAGTENHHFRLTTVYAEENTQKELRAFFKTTTSCWDTSDGRVRLDWPPHCARRGIGCPHAERSNESVTHGLRGNSTSAPVWMLVGSLSRIFSWRSDSRGNASQKKVDGGSNTVHNPNALSNCSHIVG